MVFLSIALLIAKQEIPQVASWIEKLKDKEAWNAGEVCRRHALQASTNPDFARVVEQGSVGRTQNGFFVHDITVGEMGISGAERRFDFGCYVNADGGVVRTHRDDSGINGFRGPASEELPSRFDATRGPDDG